MTTYYTPRAGSSLLYALVLPGDEKSLESTEGFLSHDELNDFIREEYPDAKCVRYAELQQILHSRQTHTPAIVDLLNKHGELLGQDLSQSFVYGSYNRPIDSLWARIESAVYIQTDRWKTGYHTYVAVPSELDKKTTDRYELRIVSHG